MTTATVLVIACGALARELAALQRQNDWAHMRIQCLPAELHNRPEKIPAAVRDAIEKHGDLYDHCFVAYADCGTGGLLDKTLEELGVERLPGAHCYEFFTGGDDFARLCDEDPATFYLTDFLARHFDRLVREGLGLDQHPELLPTYFGNYRRLLYLSQQHSPELEEQARAHADYLGLEFEHRHTGLGRVDNELSERGVRWQN